MNLTYFEQRRRELTLRRSEDFDFMVLCEFKHNMAMYHLLKDTTLAADQLRLKAEEAFFGVTS